MSRSEFPKSVRLAAFERAGGVCQCGCQQPLCTPEYDHHPVPAGLGGPNTLENCRVLNKRCHRKLTTQYDTPRVKKATRVFEKRINARPKRGGFRKAPKGFNTWTKEWRE